MVLVAASTVSQLAEGLGLTAAAMGIAGFLMHAPRALKGRDERSLREATAVGGLMGLRDRDDCHRFVCYEGNLNR